MFSRIKPEICHSKTIILLTADLYLSPTRTHTVCASKHSHSMPDAYKYNITKT